jgi:hypothetical protein
MHYFIRKFTLDQDVDGKYFQNPTKFLELNLTDQEKTTLREYLTVSQAVNHRMLTNIKTGDFYPTRLYSSTENPLVGYAVFGFNDIYDYPINNNTDGLLLQMINRVCNIFNWQSNGQRVADCAEISSFEQAEQSWRQGFTFDSASDQSCQNIASS